MKSASAALIAFLEDASEFVRADLYKDIVPNSAGEDPIQWDQKRSMGAYNYVQVGFLDRSQQYADDTATAVDQASINTYGKRQGAKVSLEAVCDAAVAAQIAQLMVQRSANIRRTAQFNVSELFGLLDPMDVITVPAPEGGKRLVMVTEANEQDDGSIQLGVEEILEGVSHAATYQRQDALGLAADFAADPGDANPPVILNPPLALTNGQLEVWITASGGVNWGGAVVWSSLDGDTYQQVGKIAQPGRYGLTTTDFPAGADPDTTDTLGVSLEPSGGALVAGTQADADAEVTLCALGTEIIAYSSAVLTGTDTYDLGTYIRRGLAGTTIADQPAGSSFVRLDDAIVAIPYAAAQVGKPLYIKLQSFNVYGQAYEDLSLCEAYEFTAEQNTAAVELVKWTEIGAIPELLTQYVGSGGTAVNTESVGTATAGQIQALPADVVQAQADIGTNAVNVATATLQGSALAAFTQAQTTIAGQPVATVVVVNQAQQQTASSAYASYFTLLGGTVNGNTGWAFDGSTVYVAAPSGSNPGQTLAQHLSYVQDVLGDGSVSIASMDEQVSGQSARITLSVNSNGQAVGFDVGTSGTAASGYFDIVSPNFRLIDAASGRTLVPMSYSSGVGWVFNANVAINGDLIVSGSVGTAAILPGAITNTPFITDTTAQNLGAIASAPVTIASLAETVSGGPVKIDATVRFVNADANHDQQLTMLLLRDGAEVDEPFDLNVRENSSGFSGGYAASTSASFVDEGASAGAHTWTITAQLIGGTSNSVTKSFARLILQDLKTET